MSMRKSNISSASKPPMPHYIHQTPLGIQHEADNEPFTTAKS